MANIIVVDSDEMLRDIIAIDLRKSGHEVVGSASIHKAIELARKNDYDILVADLNCPQLSRANLSGVLDKALLNTEIILMTDHENIEKAVEAMKPGVWDYIVKPPSLQRLSLVIDRALEKKQLVANLKHLQNKVMEEYTFGNIVAGRMRMSYEMELACAASISDNPVLITGERGTGKRLLGNTIHTNSPRGREPLIFVDLSSIDQKTMESVLFGSVQDLAAGNERGVRGAIENADRGSIFLYEITSAVPEVQDKLTEFLECSMVSRTGSKEMIYVDARVIVASSVDIKGFPKRNEFRKDLFRMISQIWIQLPPLRERKDDILLLAKHFAGRYSRQSGKQVPDISQESLTILSAYNWPGNVRELRNIMEYAVTLTGEEVITPAILIRLGLINDTDFSVTDKTDK